MPSRATPPPLHLYRHLLREASYLPRLCAPYVRQQITSRFHRHIRDAPASSSPTTARRLRAASTHLRSLHAANAGVLYNMRRILLRATGRSGRRRRTLIAQEFINTTTNTTDTTATSAAATTTTTPITPALPPDWLDAWNLPKLNALIASQYRQTFWSPRPDMKGKRFKPNAMDIPPENTFGRPLGAKAARGKLRKFYKMIINRVMAPLPRDEWERLGRLARGEEEEEGDGGDGAIWRMPARRTRCGGQGEWEGQEEKKKKKAWDWKAYAEEPVRSVERGQARSWKARTGEEGEAPFGTGMATGLHRYDRARLWRRLYTKLWQATPTMEEVEGGGGWKIEWGKVVREMQVAKPAQMGFFEEAPEKKVVRQKRRRGRKSQE